MSYRRWFLLIFLGYLIGCHKNEHHYQGYIESDTIYLAQPFAGTLIHKYVHRGEYVKKNQLLFELDPYPERYQLEQAHALLTAGESTLADLKAPRRKDEIDAIKAQIAQVESDIALSQLRFNRNQILFNKKVVAPDTLDAARELMNQALARKMQYEANLALAETGARSDQIAAQAASNEALLASANIAQWSVAQKKIYAPRDGFIFDVYYRQGEFVNASTPVASLLARENIYLEFFVPLRDLHDMNLGKQITYQYLNRDERFHAVIVYVSPIAEYTPPLVYSNENFDKLVFRIKARVLDENEVFPGEPVSINIEQTHG